MMICPKQAFFGKNIFNIIFKILIFKVPNFKKKFFQQTQGYEDVLFLDAKSVNFPKRKFFRIKPVDKPSSYHSSVSVFQKLKSDINLLTKY